MPHPRRAQANAKALAGLKTDTEAKSEDVTIESRDAKTIDGARKVYQSPDHSQAAEGDDAVERYAEPIAKKIGWRSKEEWTGDPERWTPASKFLERTPDVVETYRERMVRSSQAAVDLLAENRGTKRREAEAELREAVAAGKADEAIRAADKVAQVAGPPSDAELWAAQRPWFSTNRGAHYAAIDAAEAAAREGKSVAEQLQAADDEVKRRFPELFKGEARSERRTDPEVDTRGIERRAGDGGRESLRQATRDDPSPPDVAGGRRAPAGGVGTKPKEKGFADLPADVRATFDASFRRRGIDQERYAKGYWRDHENRR